LENVSVSKGVLASCRVVYAVNIILFTSIWRYVVCERDFSNREQIWIEGAGTSAENNEMRENLKDKEDESYRERLLNYISRLVTETMPKDV
jgi:hypothetical protein